jgi:hypothetical protein
MNMTYKQKERWREYARKLAWKIGRMRGPIPYAVPGPELNENGETHNGI